MLKEQKNTKPRNLFIYFYQKMKNKNNYDIIKILEKQ